MRGVNSLRTRQHSEHPEASLKNTTNYKRVNTRKKLFLYHYALNFSTYPVTTGAIFQNNSPPRKKKKVQQSRDPSPSSLTKANCTTGEPDWKEKQERKRGRCDGAKGWEEGEGVATGRGQTPKQQAWESYKVTRELKNSHNRHKWKSTFSIARRSGSLTTCFFSQGTHTVTRFPRLIEQ